MILCLSLFGCGNNSNKSDKIISKLEEFTTMESDNESYSFQFSNVEAGGKLIDGWILIYTDSNEFVRFADMAVDKYFDGIAKNTNSFSYDLDKNEVRIYFDSGVTDGVEIINYNLDTDEFIINKNGEKYYPSDDFLSFVDENDFLREIKKDIRNFESILNDNDLSLEDISSLRYDDIANSLE